MNWEQLNNLKNSLHGKEDKFFVGYNRPFSKAITILRNKISSTNEPLTMQFLLQAIQSLKIIGTIIQMREVEYVGI